MKHMMIALCLLGTAVPAASQAQTAAEVTSAKDEIWALERSIYAGRAKGDLSSYADNLAKNYLSWPPVSARPMGAGDLHARAARPFASQEQLEMQFVDFAMNGDVAVIYYTTHRTRRADGTASDDHFETTHTWIRENGRWHVFAGMARLATAP